MQALLGCPANKFLSGFAALREESVMQLRFLLGPAGSGKTFRCLAEIREALLESPEGSPLLLLVPKQATFQVERQLLADDRLAGYTRLQILSFDRLADFIQRELSAAPTRLLEEEGRVMALRALLGRNQSRLRIFRATARLPGFAQQLNLLLRELQQHRFSARKLAVLAEQFRSQPTLADKLHDVSLLLEAYRDWLETHQLQDADCLLELASDAIRHTEASAAPPLKVGGLWLDGFAEMTPQELDLLAAVLPICEQATLAFCLEREPVEDLSWLSTWSVVSQTFRNCHQRLASLPGCDVRVEVLKRDVAGGRFANSPALQHLEAHWANPIPGWAGESSGYRLSSTSGGEDSSKDSHAEVLNRSSQREEAPSEIHEAKSEPPDVGCYEDKGGSRLRGAPISLVSCPNPEAEAIFAAREIVRTVREDGLRYRDIAVLVRRLEGYHDVLRRAFGRYGIPCFLDRREPVSHHPLAELTRYALRLVTFNWPHDDWFGALKTGLVTEDETAVDNLENEALARGWKGTAWLQPLKIADDPDSEKFVNRWVQRVLPPFVKWRDAMEAHRRCPDGQQLALALRALWRDLKVESTLQKWSEAADPNSSAQDRLRPSSIHATVLEQMDRWLTNLELAFAGETLPLTEWLPILETGLANLTVGVIPPALDQVLIGAIDRSRNPDLKLALLLGWNEGVFPAVPAPEPLLTEAEREMLAAKDVRLALDRRQRVGHERYYGYIACTRSRERIVITYAERDAEDRVLNPSPFIAHLRRLFPDLSTETFLPSVGLTEAQHPCELMPVLVEAYRRSRRREEAESEAQSSRTNPPPHVGGYRQGNVTALWQELEQLPAFDGFRERIEAVADYTPADSLSSALAAQLYGPVLRTSVSAMEQFAACPFKFFVHAGLRAEERQQFEADVREQGSFQHEVLRRFHEELRKESRKWRDLTPSEARERIGRIGTRLVNEFRDGLFGADAQNRFTAERLTRALQDFIETAVGWMPNYGFDPFAVELAFEGESSEAHLPAWVIELGEGRQLSFRGKIDRVDLAVDREGEAARCVVVDYKSSARKIDPLLLLHGIQMQLPAYLSALRQLPNPGQVFGVGRLIPAGVFYVNLRGSYPSGADRESVLGAADEMRRAAYRHAGRFSIEALPQLDCRYQEGGSGQFNYKLTKDGRPNRTIKDLVSADEFGAMLDHVEELLRRMGQEIFQGASRLDPYRKGSEVACDRCDFRAVCRIDPWGHSFRVLKANKPEELKS